MSLNNRRPPVISGIFARCFILSLVLLSFKGFSQDSRSLKNNADSVLPGAAKRFAHYIGLEFRPGFVVPSSPFYKGVNNEELYMKHPLSGHLKYSFGLSRNTPGGRIFSNVQQGAGLAFFDFGNGAEVGTPVAAYLFQNAEVTRLASLVSLNYEWNFGLSSGWKPYDGRTNPNNVIVGSKANAYINLGLYLKWNLARRLSLTSGFDFSHFSNGNTEYPNAGVNTYGFKTGLLYGISEAPAVNQGTGVRIPEFPRHVSYDLVVFGSWRRKGVYFFGSQIASPLKYPVAGAYFAPMYNLGYKFRTGPSLDFIYDGSANVYTKDYIVGTGQDFFKPELNRQVALGLSARAEYIMPVFTIDIGIGSNVLHKGGDFRGTYQSVALKIGTSKSSFLHIGYNLKDFREPNYLMLGLGYRFHNKTPSLLYD
ncbi:acyloxyacyl hydrolase [Pararcticibacter amylolyticus]|uniref:Lipid A 3-O-deacylase n=1 Tax=Pararcticibacter amylolyticus TaxID=2173175 RepID=A0A2U2PL58_9SPHI|nr:acyloxyacyl hydrolase [Pararcticibacter amylolyticus]PWG82014.1 lipid A 3-O-deacylase [Pararcticibacter amylolyticus]